jgi:hypothetical protein
MKSLRFVQGFTLPAILADALVVTIPYIASVSLLLCIVLGIGSSIVREMTRPDPVLLDADYNSEWHNDYGKYFGSSFRGMVTVLSLFTGEGFDEGDALVRGGGWSGPQMFATSAACWILSTSLFTVLTGTMADKVMSLYRENYGALNMISRAKEGEVQRRLAPFLQALDVDGNGLVRHEDVLRAFDSDRVNSVFLYLGVTRDDMKGLFKALDCNRNGTIELSVLQKFCSQIMTGDAQAINLYKTYAAAASVSKRVLLMLEKYNHFLAQLDLTVEQIQWHNQRYEDVEAVARRYETRAAEHSTYLKQRSDMQKAYEHVAVRRKTNTSSLSRSNWRPPSNGSMRRTRPPIEKASETASSFAFQDPASTTSSLNLHV